MTRCQFRGVRRPAFSFHVPPCPPEMDPDEYERDIIKPVHVRVCNVLYVYDSRMLEPAAAPAGC